MSERLDATAVLKSGASLLRIKVAQWFGSIKKMLSHRTRPPIVIDTDRIVNELVQDQHFETLTAQLAPNLKEQIRSRARELLRHGLSKVIDVYQKALDNTHIGEEELLKRVDDLEKSIIAHLDIKNEALLVKLKAELEIKELQKQLDGSLQISKNLQYVLKRTEKQARQILRELHVGYIYQIIFLLLGATIGGLGIKVLDSLLISRASAIMIIGVLVLVVLVLLVRSVSGLLSTRNGLGIEIEASVSENAVAHSRNYFDGY